MVKILKKILKKLHSKIFSKKTFLSNGISLHDNNRIKKMRRFETNEVKLDGVPFKFSDSRGFIHSVEEIIVDKIYDFKPDNEKPLIIDCGSSFGLSIYFFLKKFPNSKIIGFEADNKIFDLLKTNVDSFKNNSNVELHNKAVWTKDETLSFYREGSLAGSLQADFSKKDDIINVQAIDLKEYLNQTVDFLKLDIEGAENSVIFHVQDKLKNVKNLFLEYHGLLGETQNLGEILNLLTKVGFEYYIRLAGETMKKPFIDKEPARFNQQLNIFCYRK
jgi:FkbM family methyltransferase